MDARNTFVSGVWALQAMSMVTVPPAMVALVFTSMFTFASDKGFSSYLRVVRYLRDRRSRSFTPGDCTHRLRANQAANSLIILLWFAFVVMRLDHTRVLLCVNGVWSFAHVPYPAHAYRYVPLTPFPFLFSLCSLDLYTASLRLKTSRTLPVVISKT